MFRLLASLLLCLLLAPIACAQHLWIDASQFNKADICVDIQAAIAALPIVPSTTTSSAVVIDARNFPVPASGGVLSCSVNPFAVFNTAVNPIVLVANGTSSTPGNQGGIVLLPGLTISTDVPWFVPQSWSVFGQGSRVTMLVPSNSFPAPSSSGTVSTVGLTNPVSISTGTFPTSVVGSILFSCPSGCTATYQNATSVGIVTDLLLGNATLNLGTPVNLASGSGFAFQTPLLAWATTTATGCCSGALQSNTTGSVIQDLGLDCTKNGGGTVAPGCIPFWDEYGQERSQLKRIRITNFTGFGIGIYGGMAQNGGPFDDIQIASNAVLGTNTCVEVGGTGLGGPSGGGQPYMRGIRGLTCTGPIQTGGVGGTGIDINTQNFSLSDAHFENFTNAVNVGSLTSARGIHVNNVTAGGFNSTAFPTNMVNINNYCVTATTNVNCQSFATSDVTVSNIYQSSASGVGTSFFALVDAISGNPPPTKTTEANLGFYSLGDGSGSGTASTRPVLTTSSSVGSSPVLVGMSSTTPVSGVQGSTGTLVQMSTGSPFATGNLLRSDGSSNTADSGIAAANIANSVTFFTNLTGVGTPNALVSANIKLWGFSLPNAITTTALAFEVTAIDNTANLYDMGIYDSAGTRKAHIGNTAGSTLFGTTTNAGRTASWTSSATLVPGKYYFATETNCPSTCASLGGVATGTFASGASGGTYVSGGLPATLTPPADSWTLGATPSFTIH